MSTGGTGDRRAWVAQVMGMPVSVHLRGPDLRGRGRRTAGIEDAVAEAYRVLRAVDATFSTYRPNSEICRLGRGELALATCTDAVREIAALCDRATALTEGWFDAHLPGPDGRRRFDPTGLVKSWAVERAATVLAGLPDHDYSVNAGGDVLAVCRDDRSPDWLVGVEDPRRRDRVLAVLPVRGGGVATSGTVARGAHVLDPRAGVPATALLSVTVAGPSLLWADVFATAALARGRSAPDWLGTLDGYSWLVVDPSGQVVSSPESARLPDPPSLPEPSDLAESSGVAEPSGVEEPRPGWDRHGLRRVTGSPAETGSAPRDAHLTMGVPPGR